MKKTILISVLIIVLVISNVVLMRQVSEAQIVLRSRQENNLSNSLIGLSFVLTESPQILDLYREDFTEEEEKLFHESLSSVSRTLDQIHGTLNYTHYDDEYWTREVYQNGVFPIYRVIKDIAEGEISSEEKIHKISSILKEQGTALSDMIFVEQIGSGGLYEEENRERIRMILEDVNESIQREL